MEVGVGRYLSILLITYFIGLILALQSAYELASWRHDMCPEGRVVDVEELGPLINLPSWLSGARALPLPRRSEP